MGGNGKLVSNETNIERKVWKMEMLGWLKHWLETDDTKLIYILAIILIANILDFLLGWINAKFNKKIDFSSTVALFGIAKKMFYFILLVLFIPIALLVPEPIGISALYVLYIGYLLTELQSVLSHLKLADDDKQNESFLEFIQKILGGKEDE